MAKYSKPEPGYPCIIEIADRNLELRFTLKVLKQLEVEHKIKLVGANFANVLFEPGQLATVLYYGLRTKQPDITEDWVSENVDASMLVDLSPVLAYATTGQWPDIDKILANLPNAPRAEVSTGLPSGLSDGSTIVRPN